MAASLLENWENSEAGFVQNEEHDLESYFYVFCWACTLHAGPNLVRPDSDMCKFDTSAISRWYAKPGVPKWDLGNTKEGMLHGPTKFDTTIVKQLHPYFDDLKNCARELRDVFFGSGETLHKRLGIPPGQPIPKTHDTLLEIFNYWYNQPLVEGTPPVEKGAHTGPNYGIVGFPSTAKQYLADLAAGLVPYCRTPSEKPLDVAADSAQRSKRGMDFDPLDADSQASTSTKRRKTGGSRKPVRASKGRRGKVLDKSVSSKLKKK